MIKGPQVPRDGFHQNDHQIPFTRIFDDGRDPSQMLTITSHVTPSIEVGLREEEEDEEEKNGEVKRLGF